MLLDTTIFIDFFRGNQKAKHFLLTCSSPLHISRIVVMELIAGATSKREINQIIKQLDGLDVAIIELNEGVSKKAGELFVLYHHRHGIGVMDTLLAATATTRNERFATHNAKYFRFIEDLHLVQPY